MKVVDREGEMPTHYRPADVRLVRMSCRHNKKVVDLQAVAVAQRKRVWLITTRSVDRNHPRKAQCNISIHYRHIDDDWPLAQRTSALGS